MGPKLPRGEMRRPNPAIVEVRTRVIFDGDLPLGRRRRCMYGLLDDDRALLQPPFQLGIAIVVITPNWDIILHSFPLLLARVTRTANLDDTFFVLTIAAAHCKTFRSNAN